MKKRIQSISKVIFTIGAWGMIVVYAIAIWQMFQLSIWRGICGLVTPVIGELSWLGETGLKTPYAIILYIDLGLICVGWTMGRLSGVEEW